MRTIQHILYSVVLSSFVLGSNATFDEAINRAVHEKSLNSIIDLGGHLRGIANYNSIPQHHTYYSKIQSTLLSIPGHARYFADEIKREQKEVAQYPTSTGPRVSYDFKRALYFETLSHLPSPETIAVLGDFLSDDIDTPPRVIEPDSDWGENPPANSFGASYVISIIGLREPPVPTESYDQDSVVRLAKTRDWWDEIKTGNKTFSFKGQPVEYRFQPDGTWETILISNPPVDGPKPAATPTPETRPEQREVPKAAPTDQKAPWWQIGVGLLILLGSIILLRKVRGRAA